MSKTQEIRDLIATSGGTITFSQLMERGGFVSRQKTEKLLDHLRRAGEIGIDRTGEEAVITQARGKPAKKRATKRASKHPGRRKRTTYRALLHKHRAPARPDVARLTLDNYIASARELRDAVINEVDHVDDNPVLTAALQTFARAEALLNATRPA